MSKKRPDWMLRCWRSIVSAYLDALKQTVLLDELKRLDLPQLEVNAQGFSMATGLGVEVGKGLGQRHRLRMDGVL